VPSDWWRADLESGSVEQVTEIFDQGMFGDFSPSGDRVAFISASGLWVMNPDGSGLTQIISSGTFYGNIEWVR
jgi:Tol biopolymer transport system component